MRTIETKIEYIRNIPKGYIAIDCDPEEVKMMISAHFGTMKTFVYNGVPGVFESRYGMACTNLLVSSIREFKASNGKISAIALGGEGVSAAIKVLGPKDAAETFDHLSTAGGAGLDFWKDDKSFSALDSFPTFDGKPISDGYANLLTVKQLKISDIFYKVVLIIADLNLEDPDKNDIKIQGLIDDIAYLKKCGARKIIIMSHRGRPEGIEHKNSMRIFADIYTNVLAERGIIAENEMAYFIDNCIGEKCKNDILNLPDGSICITENARFHADEKSEDKEIRKTHAHRVKEATGAEVLIFCAAGSAHRKDATKKYLPKIIEKKAIGILMKHELDGMSKLRKLENRPVIAIIQGAKSDKLEIVRDLFKKNLVDKMIVLGKIALNFYNGNEVASEIRSMADNRLILPERMTIAKIPADMNEKGFIDFLKTQK